MDLVKEVGKKMLMGSVNLTNLSMPVKMFEARSYLQKLTDPWVYPEWVPHPRPACNLLVEFRPGALRCRVMLGHRNSSESGERSLLSNDRHGC
jgi:hypothetical protein